MKRLLVLCGVLAGAGLSTTNDAQACGHGCGYYAAPCYSIAWEERKVVCYKPVYETHQREIVVQVCKPRFETVTKDVERVYMRTEWKDEVRERVVPYTVWTDHTYQRCVSVPVWKDVVYDRKVPFTEWKEEVREWTAYETNWKEEQREYWHTTCKMVPETVVRDVVCFRTVSVPCGVSCGGCVYYACKHEPYTQQVSYTCWKPVYERHKQVAMVKVPHCVAVKKSEKVKVPYTTWKTEQVKGRVCEYQQKWEPQTVKVPHCEYKTEKINVKVPYCVPEKKVEKVSYQVCHVDVVPEKRMEKYTTCKMVAYESVVKVPVCVPYVGCK
jgi:hypothetical protein